MTRATTRPAGHPLTGADAALIGPFIADCPLCFDVERRFGSLYERDMWATEHRRLTYHRIERRYDPSLVHQQLLRR